MSRASSLLSPIDLIGADTEHNDRIAAAIDNLVGPVRRGEMTARQALERVATSAFSVGFSAGYNYAKTEKIK